MITEQILKRSKSKLENNNENKYLSSSINRVVKHLYPLRENLDKFESEGELIKKELTDLKFSFGRAFEYTLNLRNKEYFESDDFKKRYQENKDTEIETLVRGTYISTVSIKKTLRELNSSENKVNNELKPFYTEFKSILEEFDSYNDRIKLLSKQVVKKKKEKVEKEKEEAKVASHSDVLLVKDHMSDLVLGIKDETVKSFKNSFLFQYQKVIESLQDDGLIVVNKRFKKDDPDTPKQHSFSYQDKMNVASIQNVNGQDVFKIKDKSELHSLANNEAESAFEHMRKFFSHRVSSKLALILNHKNNLDSIETNRLNSKDGAIESYLTIKFKDKSQFELSTNVEWSSLPSDWTKQFMRVPTRFHNAITPNGSKHTDLSEKYVQDLFIGANLKKESSINKIKPR